MGIAGNLEQYQQQGVIQYEKLLSIPLKDRLPGLVAQNGEKVIHALLVVMLTDFCNFFNVARPMTASQIVACGYELMITAGEDQLSMEDMALFFSRAKKGEYGKLYEGLDQAKVFDMLEQYRQERHVQYHRMKEEQHANFKSMGPSERMSTDVQHIKEAFHQANVQYYAEKMKEPPKEEK